MKKVIFGLVLSLVAGSAFAQSASVSVNGDSVTVNNQAVAAGTNVSVNAGDVVASAAGEAMINYGACRVRVAAGAAHTIGNAADVCAAVAASRPAGAAARWWPVVAFGLVGVAAAVGSSDDNEDEIPSSP